jgi:type I restriction enzyme S subunit
MSSYIPLVSLRDAGVKLIDCVHKTPEAVKSGFPYVAIPQMVEGRLDLKAARRISERDVQSWNAKCDPKEGDVVLSRRCNPGVTAVIPKGFKGSLGQNLVLLRATNGRITPEYLRWATRGREWWNEVDRYINVGAVFESLRCADIPEFQIPLPSLPEQKAIAHILGTLDDKIELNRKTNETLEAMARALFKSWFVDFDPVRAKAEGRPTGLPDEISDLFPDSFEDSELGDIPRGWEVQAVSDVVDSIFDGPHATPAESDTGNVFLGIRNMTGTKIELDEIRLIHDDDWGTWTRRVEPQSNDIVFTYEAALGLFGLIPPKLKCCLGRRMALIRPLPVNGYPHFWFHQFIAAPFQRVINERCIHGATVNRTPLTEFPSYPVLTPPSNIRLHFEELASELWAKIHALSDQSRTLVPLRDTLLPKLISGELRIPEAERLLEEVGA